MKVDYNSKRYIRFRNLVYKRDRFQCRLCGQRGGALNVHHVKRKSDHPELAYVIKNGITLCIKCHGIATGAEIMFEKIFDDLIRKTLTLEYVHKFFKALKDISPDTHEKLTRYKRLTKVINFLTTYVNERQ